MKPVQRPEQTLFCHNPDCGFSDESWRFSAHGGDDVEYTCPKCKHVAGAEALKSIEKTPETGDKKEKEPMGMRPTRPMMNFIVVDLERRTLKVIPEDRVKDEGDNVDLLLPMISPQEANGLQRRAARDFDTNLKALVENLQEGTLPYDATIDNWLNSYGIQLFEGADEEPSEMELGEEGDFEDYDEDEMLESPTMPRFSSAEFVTGFQTGVSFALSNQHLFIPPQPEPEPRLSACIVNDAAPKDKAVKLLRLLRNRKPTKQPRPTPLPRGR